MALATGTSGNAVLFAGLTVIIALAALVVPGLPFLTVMGLSAAGTVAVAVVVALTLTPAVLSLVGRKLISKRAWAKAEKHNAAPGHETEDRARDEYRSSHGWGGIVTNHPWLALLAGVVLLGVVALPASQLRLALPDASSEPVASQAFKAYDVTKRSFGEGMTGPIIVVGDFPAGLSEAEAQAKQFDVADILRGTENVSAAVPLALSEDRRTAVFQVIPDEGPASASTVRVVSELRAEKGQIKDSTGVSIGLTGQTAGNVDVSTKLGDALPPYLAIVVGLSLILLLLVFRSIWVPLLATGGFLLSLAAAFGAVVAVYQWGWLGPIFGVENPGAVLSFLPIILIGVLFGLAMDYQVFIASGMRESYMHGESAKHAVRSGFSHAAAVVTAAAIIMVSVFSGFIFSHLNMVRPLGFAMAFGVLIDAFVVRMTIVPAVMYLLGEKAWWLPRWLDRILPDVDVEGAKLRKPGTRRRTSPSLSPRKSPRADRHGPPDRHRHPAKCYLGARRSFGSAGGAPTVPGLRRSGGSPAASTPNGPAPEPRGPRPRPRTGGLRSRTARVKARSKTRRSGRRSRTPESLRRRPRCGRRGRRRPRGPIECGLDAVVDEVERGPARPLPGVTLLMRHDEDGRVKRRLFGPCVLAGVEHSLAHDARTGALERLPHDVVVAPFLAARTELQVLPEKPRPEDPPLQFHPLLPHQFLGGIGRDVPVQRHRNTEEHLPGHQPSAPFRTIPVT